MEKDDVYEELKDIVGPDAAKRLVEFYAGSNVYYPKRVVKKLRNQQIRTANKNGASYLDLTLMYGLSKRHLRRIVNKRSERNEEAHSGTKEAAYGTEGIARTE